MITYNQEKYIAQAISSILTQQTEFDFNLIIGEDRSLDKTRQICINFQKQNPEKINLILNKKNIGGMSNFTNTIDHCDGKYIALCEGDDYWTDRFKIQKQVEFLEKHPDYGIVHSDYDILYEKNGNISKSYYKTNNILIPSKHFFEMLLINNFICTATVCVRSDLIKGAIDSIGKKYFRWKMGDKPIWIEISRHSKIGYIQDSLAVRRVLKESLQHSRNKRKQYDFLKSSYDVVFFFMDSFGCSNKTKKAVLTKYNRTKLRYAYLFCDKKNAKEAFEFLKKAENDNKQKIVNYYYYLGSKNLTNWLVFWILLRGEFLRRKLLSPISPRDANEVFWFWD